eukprot:1451022-Pyramimonas_sp.AAC.1
MSSAAAQHCPRERGGQRKQTRSSLNGYINDGNSGNARSRDHIVGRGHGARRDHRDRAPRAPITPSQDT